MQSEIAAAQVMRAGSFPVGSTAMSGILQHSARNRLLSVLSPSIFARMQPDLEEIDLPLRMDLVEPNIVTSHVHFVEVGIASVVATNPDGDEIEVGHVGVEGMTGSHVLLDVATTPNRTFVQVAGSALRYPAPLLNEMLEQDMAARHLFLRYVHVNQIQLSQSALANGRLNIHRRLARWLLMCDDRLGGGNMPLTHEFVALMLGVRRSGVTSEIHVLEGLGMIRATRAHIQIRDRAKLEEIAGGGYGGPEREYDRLISHPDAPLVRTLKSSDGQPQTCAT